MSEERSRGAGPASTAAWSRLAAILAAAALTVAGLCGPTQASAKGSGPQAAASAKKLKRCAAKRKAAKRGSAKRKSAKRRAAKRRARRLRALKRACGTQRRKVPAGTPQTGIAPGPPAGTTPGVPSQPTTPTPPPAPLGTYLSVAAREFAFTLSRPSLAAGDVTVELRNVGEDPHNLVVSPDDGSRTPLSTFTETAPGGLARRSLNLPRGRYLLWCSLAGHEAAGMRATLRVGY